MEKSNKTKVILNLLFGNYKLIVPAIVMIAIIIGIVAWLNRDNSIEIGNSNDDIEISDAQITSIRNIGEWEFMSINDEEIVDTIRRGFFGDDQLARIYYGTVRLGINLHEAAEENAREVSYTFEYKKCPKQWRHTDCQPTPLYGLRTCKDRMGEII